MPGNKGKGGKQRRHAKKKHNIGEEKRQLAFKSDGEDYAKVAACQGNCRFLVECYGDGTRKMAKVRGNMRKQCWVSVGDIVLVGLRDYQESKCDITLRYTAEEIRNLVAYKELPRQGTNTAQLSLHLNGANAKFQKAIAGESAGDNDLLVNFEGEYESAPEQESESESEEYSAD